ncbi:MAG: hypothetical protein AAGF11_27960 [Myxococcota bacterium]
MTHHRPARARARARAGLSVLVLLAGLAACKRSRAPIVEEVWDEAPPVGETEALASLAPPWPAPARAKLDNGLITFWLHEPTAPVSHVRLLLPVGDAEPLRSAAVVSVLQAHITQTLASRGRNRGLWVQAERAPDRVEIVVHGATAETRRSLELLATVLSARTPTAGLEAARNDVITRLPGPVTPDERATAALVESLLGRPAGSQRAERAAVESTSRDALLEGWRILADPRRAVLVVHAADEASVHRDTLATVAERWRGQGRRRMIEQALPRLRTTAPVPDASGRLLSEPVTPLTVLPGPEGKAVLMFGRVLPTATATERSLARLAQRLLQEELDARLVVHGERSLFIVRVPLSSREPDRSTTEAIDALVALGSTRQPTQRLFQTAQLWLGARVVQASLDGEDWTALWSEAIDLSSRDEDITAALARDASGMLAPDPEALQQWMERWLDPRGGQPGWRWVVAGASNADRRKLARITALTE